MEQKSTSFSLEQMGTPIALLIGLLAIAGALYMGRPAEPLAGMDSTAPTEVTGVNIADVKTAGNPFIGSASAPVTIAVWFDFQCRYCKMFETEGLQGVKDKYVSNGKVKIVYKDHQFLGQASLDAGVYSRAVWEVAPQKWGDWMHAVMTGSAGETTLDVPALSRIALGLGIDSSRVEKLALDKRADYLALMSADKAEAAGFGITGTPGSIIGTDKVSGAQPFEEIEPFILKVLK
jgi:protein-disulfide isomerase